MQLLEYFYDKNDNVTQSNDMLPPNVISLMADFSKTVSSGGIITIGR